MAIALLFGVACQLVLRLATSMETSGGDLDALLIGLLILVFVAIRTAIAAGGTAFSALIADRTTEAERPRVLSVVWGMRLLWVLLGSVLVNQVFGSSCAADASRTAVLAGLQRLSVVTPFVLLGLGVASVWGVERRTTDLIAPVGSAHPRCSPAVGFTPIALETAVHPSGRSFPWGAVPVHLQHVPQRCGVGALRRRRLWHECLCHHIAECVDRPGFLWWLGAQWLLVD